MILVGIATAFAVQMHFLALILIPIFGIIWLWELKEKITNKKKTYHFWKGLILAIVAFLFLMSPLVIFDFKYDFQNFRAIQTFFLGDRATTVNLNPLNTVGRIVPIYTDNLINRYIAGGEPWLKISVSLLLIIPLAVFIYRLINQSVSVNSSNIF